MFPFKASLENWRDFRVVNVFCEIDTGFVSKVSSLGMLVILLMMEEFLHQLTSSLCH